MASTHLLVPIQAAYFAIEGTDDLLETYGRIRARPNPDLKVLGVVITLFDKRTNISRDTHEQIRAVFGDALFKTRISKNVRLEESPAYKETDLHLRAEIFRRRRLQETGPGGIATCRRGSGCPSLSRCGMTRIT